jgi:DNA-binding LacI/PurR family transcriptional regulator
LTTVHQPIYEMGQESMKLIMSRIHKESGKPRQVVLKSYLVERSSVLPEGPSIQKAKHQSIRAQEQS